MAPAHCVAVRTGLDPSERVALELKRAIVLYRKGKIDECAEWAECAAEDAAATSDQGALGDAYYIRSAAEGDRGGPARQYIERALPIFEELGLLHRQATVMEQHGRWRSLVLRGRMGRNRRAVPARRRSRSSGRRRADRRPLGGNHAEILLDQGHLAEASEQFAAALRTYRAATFTIGEAVVGINLGRLAAAEDRFADAHEQFVSSVQRLTEVGSQALSPEADARRAEALVLEDRHAEADQLARATLAGMRETGEVGTGTPLLERVLGWAAVQDRRPEDGPQHFDASLAVARTLGAQYEIARTLRARAEAGLGDAENADEILKRLGVVTVPAIPLP